MEALPLISVIVPVYNVEKYLDKCVQSIVDQTYTNLEIILVDDGSPDSCGTMCDTWATRDSRIRVIHKENGGSGQARNWALDAAKGALIAFVDSDDYIAKEMLFYLYTLLLDGADIAECAFVETSDDFAEFARKDITVSVFTAEEAMREHICDTAFRQVIWNKLYRRGVIGDIRFPEGTKIDDEFFTYRVLGNAKRLILSNKICYAYRQQSESVMHQKSLQKISEGLRARELRLAYLKENMPALAEEGRINLLFSCIFAMQDCLRYQPQKDQNDLKKLIKNVAAGILPIPANNQLTIKKNILMGMSQISLKGTARLLNFLEDIHVF